MTRLSMTVLSLGLAWAGVSHALPRLPESGLYEGLDPRDGLPAGPIVGAPDPEVHPSWLEVERRVRSDVTAYAVTFMPSGRVRWDMEVDRLGLVRKTTTVDGELLHTSELTYDRQGRPAAKHVVFPDGTARTWRFEYTPSGRRDRVDVATSAVDQRLASTPTGFEVRARAGRDERIERFDAQGRRLELVLESPTERVAVRFVRRPDGTLTDLTRTGSARPDGTLPLDLVPVDLARGDVWRLFGPPVRTSDSGPGAGRAVRDDWSAECWLNLTNALTYTADESVAGRDMSCICGLCVAAESQPYGVAIEGVDTHLSEGPWVAIDGVLLTAGAYAHRVATPAGPVAADQLHVGDLVLDAAGHPRPVASVVHLGRDRRPSVNLRTRSGTFVAGDLTLVSEPHLGCLPAIRWPRSGSLRSPSLGIPE